MTDKAKELIKEYSKIREYTMQMTEINDKLVELEVKLYEPKSPKIKTEDELGGGFGNSYKTPKLREMEQHDKIMKRLSVITERLETLQYINSLLCPEIKEVIDQCYIDKEKTLIEKSTEMNVSRVTLYRKVIKEIENTLKTLRISR